MLFSDRLTIGSAKDRRGYEYLTQGRGLVFGMKGTILGLSFSMADSTVQFEIV